VIVTKSDAPSKELFEPYANGAVRESSRFDIITRIGRS